MKIFSPRVLCLLFLTSSLSLAQPSSCCEGHSPTPAGECFLHSGETKIEISFTMSFNHILLPVRIDDSEPFDLILDTGMPMAGIILFDSDEVRNLKLPLTGRAVAPGEGHEGEPNLALGIDLDLPGLKLTDQMVSILPPLSKFGELGGIIGLSLFSSFVVDIDYDRKIITLHEPECFSYKGQGKKIPFTFNKYGIPEIICTAILQSGKEVPVQLIVDTGAGHALSLNVGSHPDIQVPEKAIVCSLGKTVYGELTGHMGRLRRLEIGGYGMDHVLASFNPGNDLFPSGLDKHGNLGDAVLRRFHVIFDYSRKEMIVEPAKEFSKPLHYNMAGIQCVRTEEGGMVIHTLLSESPAAESGLKKGDHVIRINGKPVAQISRDERVELFTEKGKEVELLVARDDKEWKVTLKLRPLI